MCFHALPSCHCLGFLFPPVGPMLNSVMDSLEQDCLDGLGEFPAQVFCLQEKFIMPCSKNKPAFSLV